MADSTPKSTLSRLLNLFGPLDDLDNPIWAARMCPTLAAVSLILGQTAWKTGRMHAECIVLAITMLVMLSSYMFKAKSVTLNFFAPSDAINAVWMLRLIPLAAALCIGLAQLSHWDFLTGLAFGMSCALLLTILIFGFQTTEVTPGPRQQREEIQQLHITR
jgi:hypothetical protein